MLTEKHYYSVTKWWKQLCICSVKLNGPMFMELDNWDYWVANLMTYCFSVNTKSVNPLS